MLHQAIIDFLLENSTNTVDYVQAAVEWKLECMYSGDAMLAARKQLRDLYRSLESTNVNSCLDARRILYVTDPPSTHCMCGEIIKKRYVYFNETTGKRIIVGSVCMESMGKVPIPTQLTTRIGELQDIPKNQHKLLKRDSFCFAFNACKAKLPARWGSVVSHSGRLSLSVQYYVHDLLVRLMEAPFDSCKDKHPWVVQVHVETANGSRGINKCLVWQSPDVVPPGFIVNLNDYASQVHDLVEQGLQIITNPFHDIFTSPKVYLCPDCSEPCAFIPRRMTRPFWFRNWEKYDSPDVCEWVHCGQTFRTLPPNIPNNMYY